MARKTIHNFVHYQIPGRGKNRLTLAFDDKQVETSFLDYFFEANLRHGRICHVAAILFYSIFGILDIFFFTESIFGLFIIRFAIVLPVFIFGLILSHTLSELYRKHWQALFAAYVLMTGFGCIGITALSAPPLGFWQFVGLIYCLIFGYAFIRLRFIYASVSGTVLCITYACMGLWGIKIPYPLLPIQLMYLFGINLLGMFVCYYLELSARTDFYLTQLLQEETALLDAVNMKLEQKVLERTWALERANQQLKDKIMELEKAEQARKKLEAQFLQAQKMEAVGRLAGGVAHDYNNMLTVIMGYAELIRLKLKYDNPILDNLLEIQKAARRSRDITRQLLAFSRQQIMETEILDINRLIISSEKALYQLIGEDIELKFSSKENLWPVRVDPSQIDQILFNLVINARDAMPNGGKLVISTSNEIFSEDFCLENVEYKPGEFVLLVASDNGCGMDQKTITNIFEPFFTTKDSDKGTGLGLSTVYGIVKQNKGFLIVDSAPGHGTKFKIYIPRCTDKSEINKTRKDKFIPHGNGKILLVEDDKMVRKMVKSMLEKIGYDVLVAGTPKNALELCKKKFTAIDMLLTDVVMPEMDGKILSEKITSLRPDIKILFMSGYPSDAIAHRDVLQDHIHFIQKPFTQKELAEKVYSVNHML